MTSSYSVFALNKASDTSAKAHLIRVNTLMKNTLLRALNRIIELSPSMSYSTDPSKFAAFMDYVATFSDMTCLHFEGDEQFFAVQSLPGDKRLVDILGPSCNPNVRRVRISSKILREKAQEWKNSPSSYRPEEMLSALAFGDDLVKTMQEELDCMQNGLLESAVSDEFLRKMIQDNIEWISNHSDITVLLPFILSHHDHSMAPDWPMRVPGSSPNLPQMVQAHAQYWQFAPFDPITLQPRTMVV